MLARVPERAGAAGPRGRRLRPPPPRGRPDRRCPASPRRSTGRPRCCRSAPRELAPGARRRDARRRPQVRGGHPAGPRRRRRAATSARPALPPEGPMTQPTDPAVVRSPFGGDGRSTAGCLLGRGGRVRAGAARARAARSTSGRRSTSPARSDARRHRQIATRSGRPARRSSSGAATTSSVYDAVFDRWWRAAPLAAQPERRCPATMTPTTSCRPRPAARRPAPPRRRRAAERGRDRRRDAACPMSGGDDGGRRGRHRRRIIVAPDAYCAAEALRHREFDRMTPAELRDAERLVDLLEPRLELRRTRRYELHHHGRLLAPRAMFRRNLGDRRRGRSTGSGGGRSGGRGRSSCCATSRARWSATRACCCGSCRRCRRRPR